MTFNPDRLYVVDTGDDVYLGSIVEEGNLLTVLSGLRGRPAVVHRDDVEEIVLADGHPAVTT